MTPDEISDPHLSDNGTDARQPNPDLLDDALLDRLDFDERLQSGVPESQRASDLDFIQMTGLGRSVLSQEDPMAPPPVDPTELDARRPLSFFEKGVADVDASMAPPALDAENALAEEIVPSFVPSDEEPPPTVVLPEMLVPEKETPSEPSDAATYDFEDMEPGVTSEAMSAQGVLEAEPEPIPEPDLSPQDDLVELSQAVDRLTAAPKPMPVSTQSTTEEDDSDWPEPMAAPPSSAEPPLDARELAEAERFLQELEQQPRDAEPAASDSSSTPKGEHVKDEGEYDESVYRQPRIMHRRRSSRRRHTRLRRRILRWIPRVAALILLTCGGYAVYVRLTPMLEKPVASFERAQQLLAAGRFKDASEAFAGFAAAQKDHPSRADAEFQAAYCLQLAPTQSFDEVQANKKRALQLFEQFVADNPGHAKVARAKTRMGILHYDLEEYKEAVELLQDPSLQLADPESALPALRTLARARWKLGDYDAAESVFLQAAALGDNYTPDQDYEELGDLNRWRAENAQDPAERLRCQTAAVDDWTRAMRVSTIDPANKAKIRTKCDWFSGQIQANSTEGTAKAPVPDEAVKPVDTAQPQEAAVKPADQTPQGPDPRLEVQYPGTSPVEKAPQAEEGKDEHAASSHS